MEDYENEIKIIKALSHPARLAILEILRENEACVCHMEALFGWRQAYISQQLMALREAGLVTDRRDGWNIYYRVVNPEIYAVLDAVNHLTGRANRLNFPAAMLAACTCPHCQTQVKAPVV